MDHLGKDLRKTLSRRIMGSALNHWDRVAARSCRGPARLDPATEAEEASCGTGRHPGSRRPLAAVTMPMMMTPVRTRRTPAPRP